MRELGISEDVLEMNKQHEKKCRNAFKKIKQRHVLFSMWPLSIAATSSAEHTVISLQHSLKIHHDLILSK